MSNTDATHPPVPGTGNAIAELAAFVGKSATPRKNRSSFWQAYRKASEADLRRSEPASVSDLLGKVMAISARTRRIVAPRVIVELDVFMPNGNRAVSLHLNGGR